MADLAINQLPSASIATGSNVLPIVQGGVTDQITVTNLAQGIFNLNLPLTSSGISTQVVKTPLVQNGSQSFAQDTNTGITAIINGSYSWGFYPGGTLQAAGAIIGSTFGATSVDVTQNVLLLKSLYYGAQIITAPDGTTTQTWSFKTNGDLELPTGRYITGSLLGSVTGSLSGSVNGATINNTAWTSYTPTWTSLGSNPSIGNGTITGAYKVIGKTCFVRGRITMGSSTTYGSGAWLIGLPFTASSAYGIQIPASLLNNGTAWYSGLMNGGRNGNTTYSEIQVQNVGGTADGISATYPFAWGDTDEFSFNGSYEIA